MIIENIVPIIPEKPPKIKYNVPISLWLVENNQRLSVKKLVKLLNNLFVDMLFLV